MNAFTNLVNVFMLPIGAMICTGEKTLKIYRLVVKKDMQTNHFNLNVVIDI